MKTIAACILGAALCGTAGAATAPGAPPRVLFARTALAPPDVRLYIHIEGAKDLRGELENLPVAQWADAFFQGGQFIKAWGHLSALAGLNTAGLMDIVVGRDLTLMVRGYEDQREFVLLTEVERRHAIALFKQFRAKILRPEGGTAIGLLPEHRLLLAHTPENMLIICASNRQGLMHDIRKRLAGDKAPALANEGKVMASARSLTPGQVGVFVRHQPPMGGWSTATLHFDGLRLKIQHRASFGEDPFQRPITKKQIDLAILDQFKEHALLAIIEPMDIGESMVEQFVAQLLGGLPLVNDELRKNLGDRRIVSVCEVEGRLENPRVDLHLPTGAVCLELKNGDIGERQIDRRMTALARQLNRFGKGDFKLDVPHRRKFVPGDPRAIELDPFTDWLGSKVPLVQGIDLCWQVVATEETTFCVIATHRQTLEETVKALKRKPGPEVIKGHWDNAGIVNGIRVANHLASFGNQAPLLAEPEYAEEFASTMELLSKLAFGIKSIRWKLARPCVREMFLDIDVELSPSLSAEDE